MEELLEEIARSIVEKPDEVSVRRVERADAVVFELRVAPDEIGKVIGRQGRVARALRTLVRAGGTRSGERALLEIVEE
ncbi:MAG TPA: KH domain-containing protein [Gaiellaceae bacterium]